MWPYGQTFLTFAKIAQLVERHLAKVEVAGSNPVFRSYIILPRSGGGIGRHVGLKIQWTLVRAGSSPASSTDEEKTKAKALVFLF